MPAAGRHQPHLPSAFALHHSNNRETPPHTRERLQSSLSTSQPHSPIHLYIPIHIHAPPTWSYVHPTRLVGASRESHTDTLQLGKVAHYAFDAVLGTPDTQHFCNSWLTLHLRSLRLSRRRPTLHRPHVGASLVYPSSLPPPSYERTKCLLTSP